MLVNARGVRRLIMLGCAIAGAATIPASAQAATLSTLPVPTGLAAKGLSKEVDLSWTKSSSTKVTGYDVWRRLASAPTGTGWAMIAHTTAAGYKDLQVTNGTGYKYGVRSTDATGNQSASSALVAATPQAPATSSTYVPTGASFVGSMETPLSTNFLSVTELGAAAPQEIATVARRGTHSAEMTVKPGQKRSELQGAVSGSTLKIMPGTTAWFADSIYLMPGFPTTTPSGINGFQTVLQWKDAGGTKSSSPPISLDIKNGQYTLYGGWGCPSGPKPYRLNLGPATTGTWTDFEFQIHFDTAGKGWVDAYANGQQVVSHYVPSCGTAYPAPYSQYQMIRVGYYRDPAIPTAGSIVHDEYRMGATRANVSLYG